MTALRIQKSTHTATKHCNKRKILRKKDAAHYTYCFRVSKKSTTTSNFWWGINKQKKRAKNTDGQVNMREKTTHGTATAHTEKKWQQQYIHIFIAFRLWCVYGTAGTCAYWLNIKKEGGVYNFNIQQEPFYWSNIFILRLYAHCFVYLCVCSLFSLYSWSNRPANRRNETNHCLFIHIIAQGFCYSTWIQCRLN